MSRTVTNKGLNSITVAFGQSYKVIKSYERASILTKINHPSLLPQPNDVRVCTGFHC